MSGTCIELSSDDDVEICDITDYPSDNKPNKYALQKLCNNSNIELTIDLGNTPDEAINNNVKIPSTPSKNGVSRKSKGVSEKESQRKDWTSDNKPNKYALQKLCNNSNIELTIDLGNTPDEAINNIVKIPSTPGKNGVSRKSKGVSEKESQRKEKENQPRRSESPDVVILDSEPVSRPVSPTSPRIKITSIGTLKSFFTAHNLDSKTVPKVPSNERRPSSNGISSTRPITPGTPLPSSNSRQIFSTNLANTPQRPSSGSSNVKTNRDTKHVKRLHPFACSKETPLPMLKPASEVVYIIDDDGSDEEEKVPPKSSLDKPKNCNSYTEQVVNALREKIQAEFRKAGTVKTPNSPSQTRKARVHSDQAVRSQTLAVPGSSQARVTRGLASTSTAGPSNSKSSALSIQNKATNSVENLFKKLVDICTKHFPHDNLETKMWNVFKAASETVLKSEDFISNLKAALSSAEKSNLETLDEKLLVQRDVKEVLRCLKRNPGAVDKKVKKLTKTLSILRARIKKLEEAEVKSSDEDDEGNPYVLLDKYRARAVKIYEKICELQGESTDAGRMIRQSFSFSGNSGYPKIEKALHKLYLKTKCFPDFLDVKQLVEMTMKKENIKHPPHKIQTIAQSVFIEFGNRLQRMRCFDEYSIMNEYLDEGGRDPAADDPVLKAALVSYDSTRKIRESEQKIFEEFAKKQLEEKETADKISDEQVDSESEGEASGGRDVSRELSLSDTDEGLSSGQEKKEERKKKKRKKRSSRSSASSEDEKHVRDKKRSNTQNSDSS